MKRKMLARAVVLSVAMVAGTTVLAAPAWAQGSGGATTEDRKQAAKEFADGDRAFKNGDFKAAAEAYERAYRALPHYSALWNAARAWYRANDYPRAANLYSKYLDEAPTNARDRNNAIKALKELSEKLAHLQIHATDVQDVKVDGDPVASTDVYVTPGAHVVEGHTSDGKSVRQAQNVEAGSTVSIALMPPSAAGTTPSPPPPSPPSVEPEKKKSHGLSPIVVVFGGAVTGVLAGITIWSGLDTLQQKDTFDQSPTQENLDVGKQKQTRTNILIGATIGAGVLTAMAAVFLVDWKGSSANKNDETPPQPAGASALRNVRFGVGPGSMLVQGEF